MQNSFKKYDSSAFPTFPQSIEHASMNPLLLENLSDYREVVMDNRVIKVQEPSCLFKDFINYFEDSISEQKLPSDEYYRPDLTALRLYDCADLWYVIMLVNNIYTIHKYNMKTVKYITGDQLTKLEKFVSKAKRIVRPYEETEEITNITL
ncbi:MAG: hypothetical protein [Bacteriophage sp.]|nr:MAG: hypothetical protein [Bacteriophage sp.]